MHLAIIISPQITLFAFCLLLPPNPMCVGGRGGKERKKKRKKKKKEKKKKRKKGEKKEEKKKKKKEKKSRSESRNIGERTVQFHLQQFPA